MAIPTLTRAGQAQKIGKYEGELVVKGTTLTLYVLDEKDQKVDALKMSATAEVLAKGNEKKTVELKPAGENKLAGTGDFVTDGKLRATVTLVAAGTEAGKALQHRSEVRLVRAESGLPSF